jgi:acyl-CoA reductase-like NAD-dependent aldehyde dehydrogenase
VVGRGDDSSTDMGPRITREHCERVAGYVAASAEAGARVVVDGRALKLDGDGFYFGPTLIDQVRPEMKVPNRLQPVNDSARVPHYWVLSRRWRRPPRPF